MQHKKALAIVGIAFGILAGALATMPAASAAPTAQAYDPGKVYDETFNNYTTALNVTTNMSEMMLFNLDCNNNDVDVLYVWLGANQDLSFHIYLGPTAQAPPTRYDAHLKNPNHFELVTRQVGIQFAEDFWLNTTTRLPGPYYLFLQRCVNVNGLYNVTWVASASATPDDNNDYLAEATAISDGMAVSSSVTEAYDQADLYALDAAFTPPPFVYLQLTGLTCPPSYQIEFYNATGVALEDPVPAIAVGSSCALLAAPSAYRIPAAGLYYIRIWSNGATQAYSFTFNLITYSPNRPTCIDYSTTCTVTDNYVGSSALNGLNYTFERAHMYKIFVVENDTICVNATSTQIDILARLWNQPSDLSPPLQKGFSNHAFSSGEDVETFCYRMTAAELANTTGWYFIEVRINSDLPPEGLYTLRAWLNDRPIALNRTLSNPVTTNEDTDVVMFDLNSLFYDNDCKLGDTPDCTPRIVSTGAAPAEFTFAFDGGHLVNVTATANWSGSGCQQYTGFDPRNLSAVATLCVNVLAVNDPPQVVFSETMIGMVEDQVKQAVFIGSWFTDADGDALTYTADGEMYVNPTIDNATGLADFTPVLNYNGNDIMTVTACDTNLTCIDWTVTFVIAPVNDEPTARGTLPFLECDEDSFTNMNLANVMILGTLQTAFTDVDGDTLTYVLANVPADLDVTIVGPLITITPKPNAAGIYFFEVKADDGNAQSFPASIRVTVNPINDAPEVTVRVPPPSHTTVLEGSSRDFSVTASDLDGDTLHYQWSVDGVGQTGALFANFTYHAELTNEGNRSVVIKVNVTDGNGGAHEESWTLDIGNTNQCPSVSISAPTPSQANFTEGSAVDFSAVASDPDGDTLTYSWTSDLVFAPIGHEQIFQATLRPGKHVITVRVTDGTCETASGQLIVTVKTTATGPQGDSTMLIVVAVVVIAAAAGAGIFLMRRGKKSA